MTRWGSFEQVEQLPSAPRTLLAVVRRAGDPTSGEYVVKATHAIVGVDDPRTAQARRDRFAHAADVWRRAAESSDRWAPVLESGQTDGQAWLVTERYPRTAADLAKRRQITLQRLKAVVVAVVEGLIDLEGACGRAHGNLKATNVLLGGPEAGDAVLCDPAPEPPADGRAADMRGSARLIRELVTGEAAGHAEADAADAEEADAAWRRLGFGARSWRSLVDELSEATPDDPGPDLERLLSRVRRMAPRPARVKWTAAGVAGLLVVCVALGAWFTQRPRPLNPGERAIIWRTICVEYDGWCDDLYHQLEPQLDGPGDGVEAGRVREELAPIYEAIDGLYESVPTEGTGDPLADLRFDDRDRFEAREQDAEVVPRPWGWLTLEEFDDAIVDVRDSIRALRALLGGDEWQTRAEVRSMQQTWRDRGWDQPADYLRALIEGTEPGRYRPEGEDSRYGADASRHIAENAAAMARAALHARRVQRAWSRIDGVREVVAGTGDPVLKRVANIEQVLGAFQPEEGSWSSAALREFAARTQEFAAALERAHEFVTAESGGLDRVDTELFRSESDLSDSSGALTPRLIERWIESARGYRRLDAEPIQQLRDKIASVREGIEAMLEGQEVQSEELDEGRERLDRLEGRLDRLKKERWVQKHAEAARAERARIEADLKGVSQLLVGEDYPARFAEIQTLNPGDPEVLVESWREVRRRLYEAHERDRVSRFELHRAEQGLRSAHADIHRAFEAEADLPELPETWDERSIRAAIDAARTRRMSAVVAEAERDWLPSDGRARSYGLSEGAQTLLATQSSEFDAWLEQLRAMLEDLKHAREAVRAFHGLDHRMGDSTLGEVVRGWTTGEVGEACFEAVGGDNTFDPLMTLVGRLRAVEGEQRADLVARVRRLEQEQEQEQEHVLSLAAWRRLGKVDSAWPRQAGEFAPAIAFVDALTDYVKGLPTSRFESETRREELLAELESGARERWIKAVEAAMAERRWVDLDAAFAQADAYAIDLASRRAPIRYNYRVYSIKALLGGQDAVSEERLRSEIDGFIEAARRDGLASRADVAPALEALEVDVLAKAEEGTDLTAVFDAGPGGRGWRGEATDEAEEGKRLRFTRVDWERELDFVLVAERPGSDGAGRLTYVCTTEVSIGLASDLIGSFADDAFMDMLWSETVNWFAPRPWYVPDSRRELLVRGDERLWFDWPTRVPRVTISPEVRAALPDADARLPMQCLPFDAARQIARWAGCDLPRVADWRAAAQIEERASRESGGSEVWNLRDSSFDRQLALARQARRDGFDGFPLPAEEIFRPFPEDERLGDDNADARAQRDENVLWFQPVQEGPGRVFKHLYGNVAEFVRSASDVPHVIGGSALSPLARRPLDEPTEVTGRGRRHSQYFPDVGFRLAFEVEGSLRPPLRRLLADWAATPRYIRMTE